MQSSADSKPGLVRGLGLGSAFCVVAGSVIGSGVFLVASDIAKALPSPAQALSVWVVAGVGLQPAGRASAHEQSLYFIKTFFIVLIG